jgi:peroxiredoxin Q/BCP
MFKLLPLGSLAPDFTLNDQHGHAVTLSAVGKPVVLIFYPGDFTPVCTQQLCEFRDRPRPEIQLLGINPKRDHAPFAERHQLDFPLLTDEGLKVSKAYKAVLIPGLVTNRVVYGIDASGNIRYAKVGKPPVSEVYAALGF